MRLVIVSQDMPDSSGVVLGPASTEVYSPVWDAIKGTAKVLGLTLFLPQQAILFFASGREVANKRLREAYKVGVEHGTLRARAEGNEPVSILGELVVPSDGMGHALPFESRCVTVGGITGVEDAILYDSKLFLGAFRRPEEFKAVLGADGRTSRIHVFNRRVAREVFARHGGGILEDGKYLLHPKRDNVLVPFAGFHKEMLQEMIREAHVVMGRLGARRLLVESTAGVAFSGRVISKVPSKAGEVEAGGVTSKERLLNFEWGSPTFEHEPERALEDCVWIRDNAGIMTIVDQRQRTNLTRFEEYSRVDTTFNVSLDVLSAFQSEFLWAKESTYRYSVEFFDRP